MQIPARSADGLEVRLRAGKHDILTHSGLKVRANHPRASGKDGIRPDHIRTLRRRLDRAAKKQIMKEQSAAPAWMRPHLAAIVREEPPDE